MFELASPIPRLSFDIYLAIWCEALTGQKYKTFKSIAVQVVREKN